MFLCCIPQRNRTFCVVRYTREGSIAMWDTTEEKLFQCGIQEKKHSVFCGIQQKKSLSTPWNCSVVYPTPEENLFHVIPCRKKISSIISMTEENLFHVIPCRKKISSIISMTEENLFRCIPNTEEKTLNLKNREKINFSANSSQLMNEGSRWSSMR